MGTGIDPKVDIVFKRIYGNEEYPEVLKSLLNAILAGSGVRRIDAVLFPVTAETPEPAGYHSRYELLDPETGVRFSDHWTVHVIELPKFTKPLTGLAEDLDRWAYFLKHGAELDPDNLPPSLQTPTIQIATGVLDKMSHNTAEREQYEARLKFQRDQSCYLADAREEGLEQGRQEERARMILQIGTKRLGEPPANVVSELNSITSLDRLNELADRILDCSTWDELLEHRSA